MATLFIDRTKVLATALSAVITSVFPGLAHAQIVRAAWLAGCWEARAASQVVEEQWMAPRGRTMISMGRTVHGDTLTDFEQVVLREANGRLEYEAHPFNQPMAVFVATQVTENNLLFENQLHDFPQRVGYNRRGADSLIAFVDGRINGQRRRVEFPYAKVKCGT